MKKNIIGIGMFVLALGACKPNEKHRYDKEEKHEGDRPKKKRGHQEHQEGDSEHSEQEEGIVLFSKNAQKRSGIQLGKVKSGTLSGGLSIPAEVQINPDKVAHISSLVDGKLVGVSARIGERVKVGQDLAKLRSVKLGVVRAELARATALRDLAKQTVERQKNLRAEGINSKRSLIEAEFDYQQARAERRAALSQLKVFGAKNGGGSGMMLQSPIEGMVIQRHATQGENISPEKTLFIIADLSRVWIIGRVYEQEISQIRLGMKASLSLNAYPSRTWDGKIDYVSSSLDKETRTLPIRVELDNSEGLLKPGLFGSLRISFSSGFEDGILIPSASIQTFENKSVVFVPTKHPGEFKVRRVTLGRQGAKWTQVLKGLQRDEELVVVGAFVLKSELMRAELGHGHAH